MRIDLIADIEDYFRVMIDKVDVADACKRHEELATAELRTTIAHTNALVREMHETTARGTESITREGEDLARFPCRELMSCSPAQGTGSL